MGNLLKAYLGADVAFRSFLNRSGNSVAARDLAKALVQLRRVAAACALAEAAAERDPGMDFADLVALAAAAGLAWQDMAAIVNRAHQRNPGA